MCYICSKGMELVVYSPCIIYEFFLQNCRVRSVFQKLVDEGEVRFEKVDDEQKEGIKAMFDGMEYMHCGFTFMKGVEMTY